MKKHKIIPEFINEDEEREFWQKNDSTDFIDWKKSEKVKLTKLKPSVRTISLRMPEIMLTEIQRLANKRDVPYQSLIKIFLQERLNQEITT